MDFYLFILIVLFATAIADLIVGVSNDAVNFLNTAIGSKAASRRTIMIIASLGVLAGTTFSSGIMEVARKGIFNPEFYTFHEVMIIFLAVMITDILLLDLYNTFALPTSTTVSIVFELVGGATAIAVINVWADGRPFELIFDYINTSNVLVIISSIGLSIVFAFFFGFVIQFFTRLLFSFDYERLFRKIGALYAGAAMAVTSYFILVKGAKGSTLLSGEAGAWLLENLFSVVAVSFIIWVIIWQIILSFTKINVLKVIVLVGTFSLALAFAANDLVNFVGAPLGALTSYQIGMSAGVDSFTLTMEGLAQPVQANTLILLFAGAVMVATLWLSSKSRSVTQTEINLARQNTGIERFDSIGIARSMVRIGIATGDLLKQVTPEALQQVVRRRMNPATFDALHENAQDKPAFDLLRAAVNLMVASALISFGTSLKLPLSTTFVTFMVAMSTSLADRAWGRESAVYRVTGVLTVIGGWFFTAFLAFTACFTIATLIYFGELPVIIALLILGFYFYFKTGVLHRNREEKRQAEEKAFYEALDADPEAVVNDELSTFSSKSKDFVDKAVAALQKNKRKRLKKLLKQIEEFQDDGQRIVADMIILPDSEQEKPEMMHIANEAGSLRVISTCLRAMVQEFYDYINNNHQVPDADDNQLIEQLMEEFSKIITSQIEVINNDRQNNGSDDPEASLQSFRKSVYKFSKAQLKRVKSNSSEIRRGLLLTHMAAYLLTIAEETVELSKIETL